MGRTAIVFAVGAFVIAADWARMEEPRAGAGSIAAVVAAALLPGLAPRRLRLPALVVAVVLAARVAFGVWPWHPVRWGTTVGSRFGNGFLDFYDFRLPFDPHLHAGMAAVVLVAVFGFCVALAVAVAARSATAAVAVVALGAGWPATLLTGGNEIARGAFILAAALVILVGLSGRRPSPVALPVAALVLLTAVVASTSPAIAKGEFLGWQHWDFYTRPDKAVSVRYVWNSNYDGIHFPRKTTTVLEIHASATPRYWRATALDSFDGRGWIENLRPTSRPIDPLLPRAAHERRHWQRADVTVRALRDYHLVGASVPVAYDTHGASTLYATDDVGLVPHGLQRDEEYTVWSYSPQPTPRDLIRLPARYPRALTEPGGELDVAPQVAAAPFGDPDRSRELDALFASEFNSVAAYRPLYDRAADLTRAAKTPYAAVVAIESWLRRSGGFQYSETPPPSNGLPPLVQFVTQTKTGYCQHFAGAMALMLRYIGIPARVAAGFVSGTYSHGAWTVTDHDAHTWVEVWFPHYGWLPFDPTPGRGQLSASYSASSRRFDAAAVARLFGAGKKSGFEKKLERTLVQRKGNVHSNADVPRLRHGTEGQRQHPVRNLFRGIGFVVALLVALVLGAKLAVRRSRFLVREPREVAAACRQELTDYLADQGVHAPRAATLAEIGQLVRDTFGVDASRFVDAATDARFGRLPDARRVRDELRALERALRERLTWTERARGALSLRSLGFS